MVEAFLKGRDVFVSLPTGSDNLFFSMIIHEQYVHWIHE